MHYTSAICTEFRGNDPVFFNLIKTLYYPSLHTFNLHLGQQRASSLRVRRKALLTEPVTLEPKLVLQNPPISHSKSQE